MGGPATPWVTLADAEQCPDCEGVDTNIVASMLMPASEILYRLSGRQYSGVVNDVVRPCRRDYLLENTPPARYVTTWGACVCGQPPGRGCGCGWLPEITLGGYPIRDIIEVRIDGAVLSPSAYRVDDHRWLVRIDGNAWPCCQDLAKDPLVDRGTFQVSFQWGQAPPESGVEAARVLACELARAKSSDPNCRLPERIQTIARQGQVLALLDPMVFLDKGRTGIYMIDLFLRAVNPSGLQRRAQVISPDIRRPVRRTSTLPGS